MLVLSRTRGESIMLGDNISVTIVDIRGDKVRLGITAPDSLSVHRQEVYEAIQREGSRCQNPPAVSPPDVNLHTGTHISRGPEPTPLPNPEVRHDEQVRRSIQGPGG